jgi:Tol biopolymer transport system component
MNPCLARLVMTMKSTLVLCTALVGTPIFHPQSNGAEPLRLTDDAQFKLAPSWTADGRSIVYAVHDVPNRVTVKRLWIEGRREETLLPNVSAHQFDPAISPDGTLLCFARSSGNPQLELVIHRLADRTEVVFRPLGERSTARRPQFSPDGSRVVFTMSAPGGQQIASVDAEGGDLRPLTESAGINAAPTFSPDGKQIAFASSRGGDLDIYTMQSDGSEVRRIVEHPGLDMHPVWSPDGTRVAFTTNRDGNYEVYVAPVAGETSSAQVAPLRITKNPERDDFAAWEPTGKQLLIVSERAGRFDLYLYEVEEATAP